MVQGLIGHITTGRTENNEKGIAENNGGLNLWGKDLKNQINFMERKQEMLKILNKGRGFCVLLKHLDSESNNSFTIYFALWTVLHTFTYIIWYNLYYTHFTQWETESQASEVICPRLQSS